MSIFNIFNKETKAFNNNTNIEPISWIIAGLGNPGTKFENTRHNAGFRSIEMFEQKENIKLNKIKFKSLICDTFVENNRVLLMKPQTFMNLSGEAISDAANFYKISPEKIIILSDDISLDVGRIRVRSKGSAGGQNGLKNIIYHLNSENFPRIKIGVGAKPHKDYDLADWVLSRFTQDEQEKINTACENAFMAAIQIIKNGVQSAAQIYNGKQ